MTKTYLWFIISPRLALQRFTIYVTLEELENIYQKNARRHLFMPLYLAAWTIVTASYLAYLSAIFTNYREFRMQLHALYSRRADFVI